MFLKSACAALQVFVKLSKVTNKLEIKTGEGIITKYPFITDLKVASEFCVVLADSRKCERKNIQQCTILPN
jgi:hypothetical protein